MGYPVSQGTTPQFFYRVFEIHYTGKKKENLRVCAHTTEVCRGKFQARLQAVSTVKKKICQNYAVLPKARLFETVFGVYIGSILMELISAEAAILIFD